MRAGTDSDLSTTTSRREYLVLLLVLIAVVLPFWTVIVPAATDLPQHLSQLYLLQHTLAGERPDLIVTPWYYPNTLIYWLLYGVWLIFDPIATGKIAMSGLVAAWVLSSWWLMHVYRRPFTGWLIGVPLVFNFLFSWGFLNFLIGWPVFCLFVTVARQSASPRRTVGLLFAGLLLYYAHALWFAMANVWLAVLMLERNNKERWSLSWPLLPTWVMALIWYPQLAADRAQSFNTDAAWVSMPDARLDLGHLINAMFGSVSGQIEHHIGILLGAYVLAVLLFNAGRLKATTDAPLLLAALLMIFAYLLFPDRYMNTIFFPQRWLPCGVILLLLALPAPRLPSMLALSPDLCFRYAALAGVGLIMMLSLFTIKQLQSWQNEELDGFLDAFAMVGKGEHVMGMNLYDRSSYVKGRPGLQMFAYAEAMHGAVPQFDFTEHYSGVVQYRGHPQIKAYPLYSPLLITQAQIKEFDKILVNANPEMQAYVQQRWHLVQIGNARTNWRVYRNGL